MVDIEQETLEILAEAAHKVWMEGKFRDGWKYGPVTDKEKKIHSCLIPYNQLSEADKESDRDDGAIEAITKAVKKGDKVALVGFGTFSLSKRKARTGRNPQTGATIKIAAKKLPKFSAGKAFKEAVNK